MLRYIYNHECTLCPLSAQAGEGEGICIPGDGQISARIMILGEAPGYHEAQQSKPFIGAAGDYLNKVLTNAGLRRERIFVSNVVKCRPPSNRKPTTEEEAACRTYLDRELAVVQPEAIMTLGNHALRSLTGTWGISGFAGKWRVIDDCIAGGKLLPPFGVLPNFHPAYILRNQSMADRFSAIVEEFADFSFKELL